MKGNDIPDMKTMVAKCDKCGEKRVHKIVETKREMSGEPLFVRGLLAVCSFGLTEQVTSYEAECTKCGTIRTIKK